MYNNNIINNTVKKCDNDGFIIRYLDNSDCFTTYSQFVFLQFSCIM